MRWWILSAQMDLSPCTRVYIRGGRWVSNWRDSGLRDLVLVYQKIFGSFPADVVDILCGIPVWYRGASAICLELPSRPNLWKGLWDSSGASLSLLYTSNWQFRESCLLAIFGLPWPMTLSKVIEDFPEDIVGVSATPSADYLFKVREDGRKLCTPP